MTGFTNCPIRLLSTYQGFEFSDLSTFRGRCTDSLKIVYPVSWVQFTEQDFRFGASDGT